MNLEKLKRPTFWNGGSTTKWSDTPTEISKVAQRGRASIVHILVMYPRTALSGANELFWRTSMRTIKQFCTSNLHGIIRIFVKGGV